MPFSDVIVFRTASLGTRTFFYEPNAATLCSRVMRQYKETFERFFEDFYVKVDTDPEVDLPVAL